MSDMVNVINQVAFPICACLALAWYVKYITDVNNRQEEAQEQRHADFEREITEAIRNNTAVMQRLCDKLGEEKHESSN